MTKSVREVMTAKVQTVRQEQPLVEAARLMKTQDVGSLPVVEDGRLVGTLTDRGIVLRDSPLLPDPNLHRPLVGMQALIQAGLKLEIDCANQMLSLWVP